MSRFVLLCLLLLPALPAQTPAQRPAGKKAAAKKAQAKPAQSKPASAPDHWPLREILISGNKILPAQAIIEATGLKVGEVVNEADLQRALGRLSSSGAFETASYRYDSAGQQISATFEVTEVVDLYPVVFDGLGVPPDELMKALSEQVPLFGPQVPATGPMAKRILEALQEYLAERNEGAEITNALAPGPGGKLAITFRRAAAPPKIVYVKFENSKLIRAEDLQKTLFGNSVGVPYTENRLKDLLDGNIRPLYEEKGRLQARFGPFRTEEATDATGVIVTVPVEEGDEFHFDHIEFEGNTHVSAAELRHLARLSTDELANFAMVKTAVAGIERRYQRDGYIKARATFERTLNERKKSADVVFRITEGDVYALRELTIKGLDINTEPEIRKMWAIKRGQPFDSGYPETFLKRIEEDKVLENLGGTAHHENVDEQAKMVDVELEFKGAPKGASKDSPRRRGRF